MRRPNSMQRRGVWQGAVLCVVGMLSGIPRAQEAGNMHTPDPTSGRIFGDPDVEQVLVRPFEGHVPMACTGECLWAAHPSGWGFPAGVHYYLLTRKGIGFDLRVEEGAKEITPQEGIMTPSHVRQEGHGEHVSVQGWKWITSDDALVSVLRVRNTSTKAREVTLRLGIPNTEPLGVKPPTIAYTTSLHGLTVHARIAAEGFRAEKLQGDSRGKAKDKALYVEGENPVEQRGSEGEDRKAAARGGKVLGSNFGHAAGHFARYAVTLSRPIREARLSVRYARALPNSARFALHVASNEGGRFSTGVNFEPTPGWGDAAEDFKVLTLDLGSCGRGTYTVTLTALEDGANVNLDALALHSAKEIAFPRGEDRVWFVRMLTLHPGETQEVRVVAAYAQDAERANRAVSEVVSDPAPLQTQVTAYTGWLRRNVPSFRCTDAAWEKMYWHRATSIIKKNLFRVGSGRLTRWGIAEGRWNSTWYPNMISYGAGHQIREVRWLRDPQYVRDIIATWCENEKENGIFPSHIQPNELGTGQYTDWITAAVWDAHCVHPDREFLQRYAEALKRNVEGWLRVYDGDNDGLLLVDSHWWTGMEWQPSFFYFYGYDAERQEGQLERLDLTAYVFGGAQNLSHIYEVLGDKENAARFRSIAEKIRTAALQTFWDETTQFFYSVHPQTHEPARVKEIVAVYPFYFAMFPMTIPYVNVWRSILDPEEFWTPWPVASASKKCPAYSQDEWFHGKKATVCMWNGPTWPHANSVVLSAMGQTLRLTTESPLTREHLYELFDRYTRAQFYQGDMRFPWTGEFYNGDTGAWRTAERDYDHSTWLDVLIADIAGLRPRNDDTLDVQPLLCEKTPSFVLDGVRYRGRDIALVWTRESETTASPDGQTGFRIYVNGTRVYRASMAEALRGVHALLPLP